MQQSASSVPSYGALKESGAEVCEPESLATTSQDSQDGNRYVQAFDKVNGAPTNDIHTSKYTWYTFVPLNLYEQFHNLANVYFLFIAALQTIPSISITSSQPLILMPLAFVLAVGAARDLFEDEKRKADDRAENDREVLRICNPSGAQLTVQWRDVQPGNIIRIRQGEMVPADALLIGSSDTSGGCAVETANLDGETDQKPKVPMLHEQPSLDALPAYRVEFEAPNSDLYVFKGALQKQGQERIGVGVNSLLLRGSTLEQVQWADCLVCYCGHDTRIMKNQQGVHFKASQLDKQMNAVIIVIFVVQLILCTVGGICYAVWQSMHYQSAWYLSPSPVESHMDIGFSVLLKAGTWLLQLNNMVPISLIVMLTTVKFLQGKMLQYDETCRDPRTRKCAEVHTSQVLESLGQVTHVFSDKTGTLTCNQMVYKQCAVADSIFGNEADSAREASTSTHVDFATGRKAFLCAAEKATETGDHEKQALMGDFLLCHALCHTVSVPKEETRDRYVASSPDELALVWAAHELGLTFVRQVQKTVDLRVSEAQLTGALASASGASGEQLQVEVLELCEFDNERKRMTVVVRYPNGKRMMLMKGADSSILPHVTDTVARKRAEDQLYTMACSGLRTLCLAARELSESEHASWSAKYKAALSAVSEDRAIRVQELACELETGPGLKLLGVTAIEDRLQDGVPETLEFLRSAGITTWVLTGDKMETAISIGKSCRLLTEEVENIEVTGCRADDVLKIMDVAERRHSDPTEAIAITITGSALAVVLADRPLRERFYKLAQRCQTVICCRVSPKQKADVVHVVEDFHLEQTGDQPVTLAIGDGANDVSMITAASVGVGLSGKEGAQAARSADFAMGQFRFLRRLIFVHGRESYRRNSILVSYNFYKNMVLVLPPFLFGPFMAFSGQPFYEQVLYQLYNVAFTFWPCVLFAILDRPVDNLKELEEDVRWYTPALKKQFFNIKVFLLWIGAAVLQGAFLPVAGFLALGAGHKVAGWPAMDSLWLTGTGIYFWVVLGVNLTLLRRMLSAIPITVIVMAFSVVSFPTIVLVLDSLGNPHLRGIFAPLFGSTCLWFFLTTCFVVVVFSALGEPLITLATPGGSVPAAQLEPLKHVSVEK